MSHRLVFLVLLALLALTHAQLWFGRGSVASVQVMQMQLAEQQASNEKARQENERLAMELEDLQTGLGVVEERARSELGMIRPNEIFVQISKPRP